MNVLVLTNTVDAPFFVQQLDALEERGVSFNVLCVPGNPNGTSSRTPLDYLKFIPDVLQHATSEYDLLHAHYGLTGPAAILQQKLPVILSLWGSDVHGSTNPISQLCAQFCDEVVVMSEEMQSKIHRQCHVIPNGVNLEVFRPISKNECRERIGWRTDEYQILFPYPPTRHVKNYPLAQRIVQAVDARFDVPVNLQVISGVEHKQVPEYINAADVVLMTSKSEGSPNIVKEAMACNVPVVSTEVGDVPERLQSVYPSTVSDDPQTLVEGITAILREPRRSNGRDYVEEVSIESTADRMFALYKHVVDTQQSTRKLTTPTSHRSY